jgi:hypothetical protein
MRDNERCHAKRSDGKPCRAHTVQGSSFCFAHDPSCEAKRGEARRRGGVNAHASDALPYKRLRLRTPRHVVALLEETAAAVRAGLLSVRIANSLGYIGQVALRALEAGELEERVARLEEAVSVQAGTPWEA